MAIFITEASSRRLLMKKERDDINWIISQLTEEDFNFPDDPFHIPSDVNFEYGRVWYDSHKPIGFGMMSRGADRETHKKIVNLQFALLREYRGHGLGRKIAGDCVNHGLNDPETTAIYWGADKRNTASIHLAESFGFKYLKESKDKQYNMYILRK